ncbi:MULTISPECIES: tyrosine-type recombinase/integrase [Thermodesulfovibrio]|jgi:integrase|uniref:tyrosine-type recombinase/integrase n=1 Tax=Thermodesulfovibrio TaxID=28261 RepID=UPI00261B206D|nr:tyrosine-type recombinase/integrase [Thermodesulfovibrio sp.]
MGLFKRGNVWWASVVHDGKQYRFSCKTSDKSEAQAVYAKVLLELKQGNVRKRESKPEKPKLTYAEYYEEHYLKWCNGRQAFYNKMKKYALNRMPEWFKKLKLTDIGTKEVELLQNYYMEKNLSVATCNRYISIVKASFTKAEEWGLITEQQLKAVRKVKPLKGEVSRLRFLSEEEIQNLLSHCDNYLYPIVFTALNTGMRRGEILNLKWDNVDFRTGFIYLEKTKNGYRREIPMNESLKALMRQLYTQRRLDTDYIFINPKTGTRLTEFKRSFATALKKAKIRDFRFHDLRHTFASQLIMKGADLKTVQELLGHRTLAMTLRYSHLSQSHKKEAVKLLDKAVYHNFYHNFITVGYK